MTDAETTGTFLHEAAELAGSRVTERFSLLSNEIRLAILLALWEAYEPFPAEENPVSFSALRERIGLQDSGQFNYHLEPLVGHFVEARDDGYVLRQAGHYLVRTVIAGTGLQSVSTTPADLDVTCHHCGSGSLSITYHDEGVEAFCSECEGLGVEAHGRVHRFAFNPAGLAGRAPLELLMASHMQEWAHLQMMRSGVCPACSGLVEKSVLYCENHRPNPPERCPRCRRFDEVSVHYRCTVCKHDDHAVIMAETADHPAVVSFYHDHGVDRRIDTREPDRYLRGWELLRQMNRRVVSTDPLRVRVTVPCDGDELRLLLDENINVIETTVS